jgi:hypothetical protein
MDMLGALVRKRRALIVPVESPAFRPGDPLYERTVALFRCAANDVFVLDAPLGIESEATVLRHPEYQRLMLPMSDQRASAESTIKIRSWMTQFGPGYERIVVIGFGPNMPALSRAMYGITLPVQVVPVNRQSRGLSSTVFLERLERAMSPT